MPEGMNIRDWSKKTLRMYGKLLDSHLPEERSSVISEKEFSELARNTAFIGAFAGFSGAYDERRKSERRKPAESGQTSTKRFFDKERGSQRRQISVFSKDYPKTRLQISAFVKSLRMKGVIPVLRNIISRDNLRKNSVENALSELDKISENAANAGMFHFRQKGAEKGLKEALGFATFHGNELRKKYPLKEPKRAIILPKEKPVERPDFERYQPLVSRIMEAHNAKALFKSGKSKTERYDEIDAFLAKTIFTAAFAGFAGALKEQRKTQRRSKEEPFIVLKKLLSKSGVSETSSDLWVPKTIPENAFTNLRKLKDRRTVGLYLKDSEKLKADALEFLRKHPQKGTLPRLRDFLSRGSFRDRIGRHAYSDIFRMASYAWEVGFNEISYGADAENAIRKALSHAVRYGEELRAEYPSITGVKAKKESS